MMTIGGLKNSTSPLALVAAAGFLMGGLALTPAMAADLGGDCCADLEERVAELEATTARKGNRKVSLTVSGHVARTMGWYGDEYGNSEWYSAGSGVSGSRLQVSGTAALTPKWTAGYTLRFRFDTDRSSGMTLAGTSGGNTRQGVALDRNFVFLKNDRLGTFVLGQAAGPTGGISSISLGGHAVVGDADGSDWNGSTVNGFHLEQDVSHQAVAWISPTVRGFTFAVAWSDLNVDTHANNLGLAVGGKSDAVDAWDMALRYAQEYGPIRIAAGIGYTTVDNNEAIGDAGNLMGSVALMHTPTGLNVSFAAGTEINGGLPSRAGGGRLGSLGTPTQNQFGTAAKDAQFFHVAGGINRDFTGFGNTSIYGEYGHYDYNSIAAAAVLNADGSVACTTSTGLACAANADDTVDMWGLGIVQHFDKAATELFIAYRHWDQKNTGATNLNGDLGDGTVDQVMAGMRIKF